MLKVLSYLLPALALVSCGNIRMNEFTLQSERDRFSADKIKFIDSVFTQVPDSTDEKVFTGAFWASELMLRTTPGGRDAVRNGLYNFSMFSNSFRRSLLQNAYTLYHTEFVDIIDSLIMTEKDEKLFAMMAEYIIRADSIRKDGVLVMMRNRFPGWASHPVLKGMVLSHSGYAPVTDAQINELISYRQHAGEASVYVIVHKNRDLPGYAFIQDDNGLILMEGDDTLMIRVIARSVTNLPGYLTNGNTPPGVFSMQSIAISDNIFIGPTPTLVTYLPFETDVVTFSFGGQEQGTWTEERYRSFFPPGWISIEQKNMAYYAGEAGRSEIIMHGTTIDEEFYSGQPYYPFTPSLGCICSLEIWDRKKGVPKESDQLKMIMALKRHRIDKALVYLIEK